MLWAVEIHNMKVYLLKDLVTHCLHYPVMDNSVISADFMDMNIVSNKKLIKILI